MGEAVYLEQVRANRAKLLKFSLAAGSIPWDLGYDSLSTFPRWMLYPKPFFEDTPYILEPGEYPTLEAWGTSNPTVGSLKPMTLVRSRHTHKLLRLLSQIVWSCICVQDRGTKVWNPSSW